ncbi:MAG: YdgA family protein [Thiovulaceae bacterium]|nr:YdgA family protein [Sulfurimonadaceae bacterium]
MSKKVLIIGAIIVALLAALPWVGNMSVKNLIDARISMLNENGVQVKSQDNGSNYLTSKNHYTFILKDPAAFEAYLNTLSNSQVPTYLHAMLDDVEMAADVTYSNLLFNDDVSIDIYPVAFSKAAGDRMKAEDAVLYAQMLQMLENREFMYHMDYNAAASTFNGNIKDINREITFQNGKRAKIIFEAATFNGTGTLVEPESIKLHVKNADVDFSMPEDVTMQLSLVNFESSSSFSTKNSFDLNYKADKLHFSFADKVTNLRVDISEMMTATSSNVDNGKLETKMDASIKHFMMNDANGSLELQNFSFAMDAGNIDEAAYEAFQKASEQAGVSSQHTLLASLGVVAKGFNLHVKRLSVEKIAIKDSGMMDGFDHKIDIIVKEDDDLIQKVQTAPMALLENIDINAKLQFASSLYDFMKTQGILSMADMFAKKEGDNIVFDISLQEGKAEVNGARL